MAIKKRTPARRKPVSRTPARKTPARRRPAAPVRRRRRTVKKKSALGDMFSPDSAEKGFKMLVGVGAGYVAAEQGGKWLNPDGTKTQLEIIAKLAGGFLMATAGKMPNVGAGIIASGMRKVLESSGLGLGDSRTNYLQDRPLIFDSGMNLQDDSLQGGYTSAYQSSQY